MIILPPVVFVGPGGSIQNGVNQVDPYGTVIVAAGVYNENVTVNKPGVQLHGAQYGIDARQRLYPVTESIINGTVSLMEQKTVIDGFTVQNVVGNAGIFTSATFSGYWVFNNIVQNNTIGIYLNSADGTFTQVKQNVVRSNRRPGAASGNGIYSDQGLRNAVIRDNFLTGHDPVNAAGINIAPVTQNAASRIWITDNLLFVDSSIALTNTTVTAVSRNRLILNVGASAIFFGGGTSFTDIEGNMIQNNSRGISVTTAFSPTGTENLEIRINHNNIQGNTLAGLQVGNNTYSGILDATNNFWGSASGPSGMGPGTGDAIINNDPDTTILFVPFLTDPIATVPSEGPNEESPNES